MIALSLLAACLPEAQDGGEDSPNDTSAPEDTSAEAQEADDARVRALTDLPEGDDPCAEPQLVRVQETVDGDTFHALPEGDDWYFSVRIIGVDTPEVQHDDPAECYGNEAWVYSSEELKGNLVWLTFDADCYDDFDRTLAYVIRGEGEAGFFNRALARNGYATELTIAPNDTYADEIRDDVRAARDDGLGLWSACNR